MDPCGQANKGRRGGDKRASSEDEHNVICFSIQKSTISLLDSLPAIGSHDRSIYNHTSLRSFIIFIG